jgi:hypothetical protein
LEYGPQRSYVDTNFHGSSNREKVNELCARLKRRWRREKNAAETSLTFGGVVCLSREFLATDPKHRFAALDPLAQEVCSQEFLDQAGSRWA